MDYLKVGDVVFLKSGGPEMIIDTISADHIICHWFDNEERVHTHGFKPHTLTKKVKQEIKMDFKVGDVVFLKSGGPAMTIANIQGDAVYLVWMTNEGIAQKANVRSRTLTHSFGRN